MTAFRILDPFPAYQNTQGGPVSGGTLRFFTTATTTPTNVFSDKALTVNVGATVTLDSQGRTNSDVWVRLFFSRASTTTSHFRPAKSSLRIILSVCSIAGAGDPV